MTNPLPIFRLLQFFIAICLSSTSFDLNAQCEGTPVNTNSCPGGAAGQESKGDFFTLRYCGPDTFYVDSFNCFVNFNIPSGNLNISPNFNASALSVALTGYSMGDAIPAGQAVSVVYIISGNSPPVSDTLCFTLFFADTIAPVINSVISNVTEACDTADYVAWAAAQKALLMATSTDNCLVDSVYYTPANFTGDCGSQLATFHVLDEFGNKATTTATFTKTDLVQPQLLNLPASPVNILCPDPLPPIAMVMASDNCLTGNIPVSFIQDSTQTGFTRTWSANDGCGNSVSFSQIINMTDTVAPTALCKAATVQLDATGQGVLTTAQVNNNSTDNCDWGFLTFLLSETAFDCSNLGANAVTLTVKDVSNNTSTCTATVTVVDGVAPTALCKNATISLNAAGQATLAAALVNNNSTDACGLGILSVSPANFTCANIGGNAAQLTVSDVNGNVSTCQALVTVSDNIPPIVACQSATITLGTSGTANIQPIEIFNAGASFDNCGALNLVSATPSLFGCGDVGVNAVTLTVRDAANNTSTCTATVTVVDGVAPTALCKNATISLDAAGEATLTAALVDNNSTDACGLGMLSVTPASFTCANIGSNAAQLTVSDVNGNVSTCLALVTVLDNIPPVVVCQNIAITLGTSGTANIQPIQIFNAGASSDNCGVLNLVSTTPSLFDCGDVGGNSVTLVVSDVSGNVGTCQALVSVSDNIPPEVACQNATITLGTSGTANIVPIQIFNAGASSDNCSSVNLVSAAPSLFDCGNVGANVVTLTVKDAANNTSTCTATVTVVDGVAPTALCKNATISLNAAGQATLAAALVNNNSTDACGLGILSVSPANFTCANIGGNAAQLTVSDVNGNVSTCQALVTVSDNIPPIVACQSATITLGTSGTANIQPIEIFNAGASFDNCGALNLVSATPSLFDCEDVGVNAVTLTVNDGKGNTSTCQATVTVNAVYPQLTVQTSPEVCGTSVGSIAMEVTGAGSAQVAYSIDGGATWQFSGYFPNISSGVYSVMVNAPGFYSCLSPPQSVTVSATGPTQQNTWTGAAASNNNSGWSNPANWSLNVKPVFCHDVVIPSGFDVVIPAGFQAVGNTLQVDVNATLTMEATATLTIEN
jgi:hypothetical protein